MYKTWTSSAAEPAALARGLEAHLNEFAEELLSVCYAIGDEHHVLAVYKPLEASSPEARTAAVAVAEKIIEQGSS